jgi:hypothetical protein
MGIEASYSSGSAGITAACLPPSGLHKVKLEEEKSLSVRQRGGSLSINPPSLHEDLPNIVSQPIRARKLLNEMLDGILSQSKEVGARHRIRVLSVSDGIGLLDDVGPCTSSGAGDDGTIRNVRGHDLEFGPVTTI